MENHELPPISYKNVRIVLTALGGFALSVVSAALFVVLTTWSKAPTMAADIKFIIWALAAMFLGSLLTVIAPWLPIIRHR